jgi:DNA primase
VLDGNKYVGLKGHGEPRLFNMDALVMARRVFIVEGEFDAIMMHQRGYSAVSSTGGCNSFPMSFAVHFLHSARVYVCYDHDDGGEEGMRHVQEVVPKARILKLPLGRKGDVSDFLRWHTNDEFEDLVRQSDGGGSYLLKASNGMIHDMGLLCR